MSSEPVTRSDTQTGTVANDKFALGRTAIDPGDDDLDRRFSQLVESGDRDALTAFVYRYSSRVSLGRGHARLREWLAHFTEEEVSESPPLSIAYGTLLAREGDIAGAMLWLNSAERATSEPMPGGRRSARSAAAAIKSAMGVATESDVELPGELAMVVNDMLVGWRALMDLDLVAAESKFAELETAAAQLPMLDVVRLTMLAMAADALSRPDRALMYTDRAQAIISANRWEADSSTFQFDALAARLRLDSGDVGRAHALADACAPKLFALCQVPQLRIPISLVELADVHFRLGRGAAARGYLDQARFRLRQWPDSAYAQRRLHQVSSMIVGRRTHYGRWPAAIGVVDTIRNSSSAVSAHPSVAAADRRRTLRRPEHGSHSRAIDLPEAAGDRPPGSGRRGPAGRPHALRRLTRRRRSRRYTPGDTSVASPRSSIRRRCSSAVRRSTAAVNVWLTDAR